MNIIRALLVVLGCLALGEATVWILGLKLPGSIVGMALLFAALQAGWVKLSWVGELADILMAKVFDSDGHNRQYDLRIVGDRQSA